VQFRAQADWTLTHNDTEQSTLEASITLDGVTRTYGSSDHRMNDFQFADMYQSMSADKMFWASNKPAQ
jgi:hypothetical protein